LVSADVTPVARIVGVESDPIVSPGEHFSVVVSVEYSAAQSADIAILDTLSGVIMDSKDLFTPMSAGTTAYAFQLTGRATPGAWKLQANVRTWWRNAWYANPNGGTYPFELTVLDLTNATVVFTSNLLSGSIAFDGVTYPVSPAGLEITALRGLHTIQAERELPCGEGARAVFDRWTDGVQSPSRTIYLAERLELSLVYRTQYLLSVESEFGQTVGSGWYPAGMNATFAVLATSSSVTSQAGSGAVHRFTHWSGDSESTSSLGWVVMERPKEVIANWADETGQAAHGSRLVTLSVILLLCSSALITASVTLRLGRRMRPRSLTTKGRNIARALLVALVFAVLVSGSLHQNAHANATTEPETVRIGDAAR